MKHRETSQYLVEFAEGSLAAPRRADVAAHLETCGECRSWLATYLMFEEAAATGQSHPDSETLAGHAVEPAILAPGTRAELESHLAACSGCSREYRLTRQALTESRPGEAGEGEGAVPIPSPASIQPWAAAGLLAAALLLALMTVDPRTASPPDLSDTVINGRQVVESDQRLLASNVLLTESSNLHLKATHGVVLREGFSVEKGARLAISTGARDET